MEPSWKDAFEFCQSCGSIHDPREFAAEVMVRLQKYCIFQKGIIFFFDSNGKVFDRYLFNRDDKWARLYLEYYSKMELGKNAHYSIYTPDRESARNCRAIVTSWDEEHSGEEFIANYIRPQGLRHSLGYLLCDNNDRPRAVCSLDKLDSEGFSREEVAFIDLILPQLNNLYKNFFSYQLSAKDVSEIDWAATGLTPREIKIATLLCKGMSPQHIGETLFITRATVQKHLSNIYGKLHVSSHRELLARLLG